jgi:hypothetical protein
MKTAPGQMIEPGGNIGCYTRHGLTNGFFDVIHQRWNFPADITDKDVMHGRWKQEEHRQDKN